MKSRLRIFIALLLLIVVVPLAWLTATESGLLWAYKQAEPYLPDGLHISKLGGTLIGPATVEGIEFQHNGLIISTEHILLDWLPIQLLYAKVDITRLQVRALNITLPKSEKTDEPLKLPDISLPWRTMLKDAQIDGLTVNQNEQTVNIKQIRLNANTGISQLNIKTLSVIADTYSLNVKGKLQPTQNYKHELAIQWQTTLPSNAVIEGKGEISGDIQNTQIKQNINGPVKALLEAKVDNLLTQLNWQASVVVSAFDMSKLNADWPALVGDLNVKGQGDLSTADLNGTLNGNHPEFGPFDAGFKLQRRLDNSIQIDNLTLHASVSNTYLHAAGQWLPGPDPAKNGGDITLALDWQNLRWPLKDDAWFDSAVGSGWLDGNIQQYRIGLATDRPWQQAPPSTWYAAAEGNLDGMKFHSLRVAALNGETLATGQLNWSPQLVWQAQISANNIDPASLWPQWPGQLNAKLTSKGQYQNEQLIIDADIEHLKGKLRDYPVSLRSSHVGWRDNGLDIDHIDFRSGKAKINLEGRVADTLKLKWAITATDLAELYPQAKGQLNAEGTLTGPRITPLIQAKFSSKALSLPDYKIGKLDGKLSMDMFQWKQLDINISAQSLELQGYALQTLTVTSAKQRIVAKAVSEKLTALVELQGKTDGQGWNGRIERIDINSQQFRDWRLKAPAVLQANADTLKIQSFCLQSKKSDICMELQKQGDNWQSTLDAKKLPLMLLSPWIPADLNLDGVADAKADIQLQSDRITGAANIRLPAGVVLHPLIEGQHESWTYRGGTVVISLNDQGIKARSEIAMSSGDLLQITAELPGAKLLSLDPQRQRLHAEGLLSIRDLALIETLIPEAQNLQGELSLKIAAGGTLALPRLSGNANLINGAFEIPRLGLTIDKLTLNGQSDDLEKFNFLIDARSGEGNLAIKGQTLLDKTTGWPTEINIKGKNFEVSRIPEARVLISPDLQINLQKNRINITGNVHIPFAKLQPKDVTMAARVSEDTVIIGSEQPKEQKWSVVTKTRLTLGERVNFFGFGFEGRLGGSLLLEDEPGQLTKATGEISIPEGRYRAYGQRLDIELGRLLFSGGPITNPGLDLRAVRRTNDVVAGLKVKGYLNQPQLELFSIPAMGQTDALAYLLLGRPIEKASGEDGAMMAKAALALGLSGGDRLARILGDRFGLDEMRVESSEKGDQASLVMGRYLSPKLYVSYGVGLIEAINTFTVRYKISDKWQLKAESGESQGADILYTIER